MFKFAIAVPPIAPLIVASSTGSARVLHGRATRIGCTIWYVPLELTDAELATAATACRAMAYQDGERPKKMARPESFELPLALAREQRAAPRTALACARWHPQAASKASPLSRATDKWQNRAYATARRPPVSCDSAGARRRSLRARGFHGRSTGAARPAGGGPQDAGCILRILPALDE